MGQGNTLEITTVTAIAPPPVSTEEFVKRLLSTEHALRRRALIDHCSLPSDRLKGTVERLLDEAVKCFGADPSRMEWICAAAALLAERSGDEFLQAMVIMRQGDAARALGRNTAACDLYDASRAIFTRLNRPVEAVRTRLGWIAATARLGRLTDALDAARSARRLLEALGETALVAMVDLNTGVVHNEHGQHNLALKRYASALNFFKSIGDDGQLQAARCYQGIGSALGQLGRHREALDKLELARSTYDRVGEVGGAARVSRSIGVTAMSLGRYSEALRAFQSAQSIFRSLGLTSMVGTLAYYTAECYLCLNRPADALAALDSSRPDLETADYAIAELGAATRRVAAYMLLGQTDEALRTINEADQRFPTGVTQHRAWLAVQRAMVQFQNGDLDGSVQTARHAREMAATAGMRRLVAEALITESAASLSLGAVVDARRLAGRARRIAQDIDAAPLLYRCYELLGRIADSDRRWKLAARRYEAAIQQLEREQRGVIFEFRGSFAAGRGTAYERLAMLQLQAGRQAEAFATAERAKSRALSDAIAGNVQLRPRGSTMIRRITRELAHAREDYAAEYRHTHDQDSDRSRERREELERRIARLIQQLQLAGDAGEIADLHGATPNVRVPSIPPDTVLLEYFFCGDEILRFRVDAGRVEGVVLEGAVPEVERLLRSFRLNLDATERAAPSQREALIGQARLVLSRLYGKLLGDLPGLDQYKSLVIVPHGILHYVPFHALHDGERYLVERLSVSYAPSAALYTICRSRRPRRSGSLVLGHSAGGRLPFTLREADAVADLLRVSPFEEAKATRSLIETEGRRTALIHIAAHGEFRADAPLFSCIQLADGPLTTADVFNLDLRAALVTLSACETGRSVLGGGDELAGLSRAFLYAGAAGLLVSQWRVKDATTAELMTKFYGELRRGVGRASALRAAQLACIATGRRSGRSHPFFWAGFQIVGDNQALKLRPARAPKEDRTQ